MAFVSCSGKSYALMAYLGFLIILVWFPCFLVLLVCAFLSLPILFIRGRERYHHPLSCIWRGANALIMLLMFPIWRMRIVHEEGSQGVRAPESGRGSVVFVNHRSNADPFFVALLQLQLCFEARYIYKSSLGKLPIGGWNTVLAGDLSAHFGDKGKIAAMLERSREVLRSGYNIVVFPEGTRSPSGVLQSFKPTFFDICAELGCPAVPVVLLGTESAWPAGGYQIGCSKVTAVVGKPLAAEAGEGASLSAGVAQAFRDLAQQALTFSGDKISASDPLITNRPYEWWTPPEELRGLKEDELLQLLQSGKSHERGKGIA